MNPNNPPIPDFDFSFGNVRCFSSKISPTLYFVYKSIHYSHFRPDYFDEEWAIDSIRIEGIKSVQEAEEYLDKTVFRLGHLEEWPYKNWPDIGLDDWEQFNERTNPFEKWGDCDFKHQEPINFFNSAMRAKNFDEKFLHFFRILEFYSSINISQEIQQLRQLNIDEKEFVQRTTKLIRSRYDQLLAKVLETLATREILEKAKNKNLISSLKVKSLATYLSDKRNAIVHSKRDTDKRVELGPRYLSDGEDPDDLKILLALVLCGIQKWSILEGSS